MIHEKWVYFDEKLTKFVTKLYPENFIEMFLNLHQICAKLLAFEQKRTLII